MKCKYADLNGKEHKCSDYYYSHGTKKNGIYCRLVEWKKKIGVCPYDRNIHSTLKKIRKSIKSKTQKTL
jgi:hypothetical protein